MRVYAGQRQSSGIVGTEPAGLEHGHELREHRRLERRAQPRDIALREVVARDTPDRRARVGRLEDIDPRGDDGARKELPPEHEREFTP